MTQLAQVPNYIDLVAVKGDDVMFHFELIGWNNDPISDMLARFIVRNGETTLLSIDSNSSGIVLTDSPASIDLTLTHAQTNALGRSVNEYYLELIDPLGAITETLSGNLQILQRGGDQAQVDTIRADIQIGLRGPAGPQGLPGSGSTVQLNFAYGDATPVTLLTLSPGQTLFLTECIITEAFDGVGSTLSVGTDADHDQFLSALAIDSATSASYQSHQVLQAGLSTLIKLFITPGSGASRGAGFVLLHTS